MPSGQKLGRPFWVFWSAVTATNVGDGIRLVALPLLATQVTENPALIALVTVFTYVPALIFGQVAGVFVDRVRKRRLIAQSQVGRAVVLAFVAVAIALGMLDITMLCMAAFLYGVGEAVSDPASHAILPQSQSLKVKRPGACARYISPGVRIRALSCYLLTCRAAPKSREVRNVTQESHAAAAFTSPFAGALDFER